MNRLKEIRRLMDIPRAGSGSSAEYRQIKAIYAELKSDWMDINGFSKGSDFSTHSLARGKNFDGRDWSRWSKEDLAWALDHQWYCKKGRKTACIVNEPYEFKWENGRDATTDPNLAVHMPPNPKASFWNPGFTLFVVIMRLGDPAPQWLADQLDFE